MSTTTDLAVESDHADTAEETVPTQRSVVGPVDEDELASWKSQWGHEVDTIVHADPNEIVLEDNVRSLKVKTRAATVRNYQESGVTTAANGYRSMDGTIVIRSGQRRVLHARKAGTTVPVWMHLPPQGDDQTREIDRVLEQLDENDHREPLTHQENTQAYQYLLELGVSPTQIAKRRGQQRKVVQNTLAAGASELATKAGDRYGLALPQLAEIAWFDQQGKTEQAKELILAANERPRNFEMLAQKFRNDLREDEIRQGLVDAVTAEFDTTDVAVLAEDSDEAQSALPLVDLRPSPDSPRGTELTAEEHASCAGHCVRVGRRYLRDDEEDPHGIGYVMVARYACHNFRAHGHALRWVPDSSAEAPDENDDRDAEVQWNRAQRRWVRENNKLWRAAKPKRLDWLKSFAGRRQVPTGLQNWLAVQKANGDKPLVRAMERGHTLACALLGRDDLVAYLERLSAQQATVLDAFLTLAAHEEALQRDRSPWRAPNHLQQQYLQTLQDFGHTLSDIELKVLAPDDEGEAVTQLVDEEISSDGTFDDPDEALDPADEQTTDHD
ncbi:MULTISPECIES: ParB/RepB/Spo0J family partition protein [Amycolatopsis]|uniref:ParB/RepB/Spo0J family partition protein n=1 Tax=Amycolatopsis albidoflavus TaxID=102226 RepID=A0ABW5HRG0_9PSEU